MAASDSSSISFEFTDHDGNRIVGGPIQISEFHIRQASRRLRIPKTVATDNPFNTIYSGYHAKDNNVKTWVQEEDTHYENRPLQIRSGRLLTNAQKREFKKIYAVAKQHLGRVRRPTVTVIPAVQFNGSKIKYGFAVYIHLHSGSAKAKSVYSFADSPVAAFQDGLEMAKSNKAWKGRNKRLRQSGVRAAEARKTDLLSGPRATMEGDLVTYADLLKSQDIERGWWAHKGSQNSASEITDDKEAAWRLAEKEVRHLKARGRITLVSDKGGPVRPPEFEGSVAAQHSRREALTS